jgi:hypothetical protein
MKYAIFFLALVTVVMAGCATKTVIDFSNLSSVTPPSTLTPVKVGDSFKVGDVLIENTSKVKLVVLPFQWGSSKYDQACPPGVIGWTPEGHVEIVQKNMSGGTGPELHFNNANLGIIAPKTATVSGLKFRFGDHGGNINLILNGIMLNYKNFKAIPPQPGVNLVVSPGLPLGTLELSGSVGQFFFTFPCPAFFPVQKYTAVVGGGQELWIDDVEFTLQ